MNNSRRKVQIFTFQRWIFGKDLRRSAADREHDDGRFWGEPAVSTADGRSIVTGREHLQSFIDEHSYLSWLGLRVERPKRDPRTPCSVRRKTAQSGDRPRCRPRRRRTGARGPAGGFALRTTLADPADARLVTTDLNISYIRPAGDDLLAEATVVRSGGSMGVVRVTVRTVDPDGNRTETAVGRTSYRLFRR